MILKAETPFIYQGTVQRTAKGTGNPFNLVKLADAKAFETHDFFLRDTVNVAHIPIGAEVLASFELSKQGYRTNTNLIALEVL